MEIYLYNGSYQTLPNEIKSGGIEFVEQHHFSACSAQVVLQLIEVLKTPYPWASLSAVLVAWLKYKPSRKIICTMKKDGAGVHIEGMSEAEVERILEKTSFVSVYESNDQEQS